MLSIIAYYHICHVSWPYRSFMNSHKATPSIRKAHDLRRAAMYEHTGAKAAPETPESERNRSTAVETHKPAASEEK